MKINLPGVCARLLRRVGILGPYWSAPGRYIALFLIIYLEIGLLDYFLCGSFPHSYSLANIGGEIYYRYSHNLSKELLSDSEDKQTPI